MACCRYRVLHHPPGGRQQRAGGLWPNGYTERPGKVLVVFAVTAAHVDADDPLSGLELGERPDPVPTDGWVTVTVKAAALNHHDVWTLRGVGISADRLPIVLGCDAAGLDADGHEVIVHSVIADPDAGGGDETLDPGRSLLSERYDGTFAGQVAVPRRNLVPKPSALSFEEAACLPTAYLTAYKMLFVKSGAQPGATLLVQGAGGGVATALIVLGRAAGYRVWATSRSEAKRERAVKLGADQAFPAGARLPERVDVVMETVGQATWAHSVRSLRPGGRIVISGATSGDAPPAELTRIFFTQLSVTGSTMGTRDQLGRLARFCEQTGARPVIDRVLPLDQARDGFEAMITGDLFGKIVFVVLARGGRPPGTPRCAPRPAAAAAVLARGDDPPDPPLRSAPRCGRRRVGPGGRPPGPPAALRAPLRPPP
jgi:NADPH:quinone reductase-like Zn-dependent oxidoreductase